MTASLVNHAHFKSNRKRKEPRPKPSSSPYFGRSKEEWRAITLDLLEQHPLSADALIGAVLDSWEQIFATHIGPARIGSEILPSPQIMGFLLHELIPINISTSSPDWRRDASYSEKDLVYIPESSYSVEIKTSSHSTDVFGNRSYGQEGETTKKDKSGYYCAVNFQSWAASDFPQIKTIRFGWIDATDWISQSASTGQNSSIAGDAYAHQLAYLYEL